MLPNGFVLRTFLIVFLQIAAALPAVASGGVFSPADVLEVKRAQDVAISPDGRNVAYTVRVPRSTKDEAGPDYRELYVVSVESGKIRPFITGKVSVHSPKWSPDGSAIAFTTQRGEKAKTQVWVIPADGGEAVQVTSSKTNVSTFDWHADGRRIAYVATDPETKSEEKLDKKGYGFVFFEENLKHRNLYIVELPSKGETVEAKQLTNDLTVWTFEVSPDGRNVALGASTKNLVDHRYVFQRLYLLTLSDLNVRQITDNPGKIGNFAFSPDGSRIAYTAAKTRQDHNVSQVYVVDGGGEPAKNLTPPDYRGHADWVGWKDRETVVYRGAEGAWNTLYTVSTRGGESKMIFGSKNARIIFDTPSYTKDFKHFAFTGSAPDVPEDVYYWRPGQAVRRLTHLNPWITERKLGRQEVVRYKARDGLEIEGILYYPVDYQPGRKYPTIITVHGGPESHYTNGWHTGYFQPAQVFAGEGYAVFLPNYRSSTGYGVEFTKDHLGDPAGKEFDDVADGIVFLINEGIADPERIGLGGGSYGGFAAAWFSSYYTKYVKAVCMYVGISDLISKRGTTDIPYEELFVHSGSKLEEMWDISLQRSPVYYAHQSRTAVLILGGTSDTRVHPSQSLEYYRSLKMNDHPAVRLVQYPGEGHGNQKQPGRIDVLHRTLQWFNWYVRDGKPIDGPMPPLDISESYGVDLEKD